MTPLEDMSTVSPEDPASVLLKLLNTADGRALVSSGGRLEGIVSRRDLFDYITLKADISLG
jgi:hypothetical protein